MVLLLLLLLWNRHLGYQILVEQTFALLGHGHAQVFLVVVPAEFHNRENQQRHPDGKRQPDSKLGRGHLQKESVGIYPVSPVDRIPGGAAARLESSRHFGTPDPESERHTEGCNEDKYAHDYADEDVYEGGEEAGVATSPEELDKAGKLDERYDKHDYGHKDGKVAVSLRRPVHLELTIRLLPHTRGEQQAATLKLILMHRHGNAYH